MIIYFIVFRKDIYMQRHAYTQKNVINNKIMRVKFKAQYANHFLLYKEVFIILNQHQI